MLLLDIQALVPTSPKILRFYQSESLFCHQHGTKLDHSINFIGIMDCVLGHIAYHSWATIVYMEKREGL